MKSSNWIEQQLDSEIDPAFAARARFIVEKVQQSRPSRILDLGCGRGFYTNLLARLEFVDSVVGIDQSDSYLAKARRISRELPNVTFVRGDICQLPFNDHQFDLVVCSEVLEHVKEPTWAVAHIKRVLIPGGVLEGSVPHASFPFLWDPVNWVLGLFDFHLPKEWLSVAGIWADHERLYSRNELHSLLSAYLDIEEVREAISVCWPFSHFLIYGLGRNLIELGMFPDLSRFSSAQPGRIKRILARAMALPDRMIADYPSQNTVNLCFAAYRK